MRPRGPPLGAPKEVPPGRLLFSPRDQAGRAGIVDLVTLSQCHVSCEPLGLADIDSAGHWRQPSWQQVAASQRPGAGLWRPPAV